MNHRLARMAVVLLAAALLLAVLGGVACSTARADAVSENTAAREWAIKIGWLQGIRKVELIRNDLLSVTLDAGITGAIVHPTPEYQGKSQDVIAACGYATDFVKPAAFTITSATDANYQAGTSPADVSMNSLPLKNKSGGGKINGVAAPGCAWTIFYTPLYQYEYYLFLPKPLKSGASYKISVNTTKPKTPGVRYDSVFAYDESTTASKVIKINQVAFSPVAKTRYAYLGWWAAGKGPVDYSSLSKFSVVNEATGAAALTGAIALRAVPEETMVKLTGEKVYEMDISALRPGTYHICIPGFARSETFAIGGNNVYALYYYTMRSVFLQRCGQEFGPPYTWAVRPACHTKFWEAGFPVQDAEFLNSENEKVLKKCPPAANMPQKSFIGGIHDAADYDIQCGHMGNINDLMLAYELYPEVLKDGDLDIPESGNGIPDVLDNVEWLLRFFMLNQYPDGAIPASKPNMSDGLTQWRAKDPSFTGKGYNDLICDGKAPPFGVVPPCDNSTTLFAASAARFSRLVRPFNAAMADRYLASAKKAFEYAISHTPMETYNAYTTERYPLHKPENDKPWVAGSPANHTGMKGWVAAEMMRATGDKSYNHYIDEALTVGRGMWGPLREIRWAYLNLDPAVADPALQAKCRKDYLSKADELVSATSKDVNRTGYGNGESVGWGAGNPVGYFMTLVSAYGLTKDQKYLDAASFNADYLLGEMPISWCWLTHMGYRSPQNPWMSYYLWDKYTPGDDFSNFGAPMAGYNIYGLGWSWGDWFDKGAKRPVRRYWNDFTIGFGGAAWCQSSEFTPNTLTGAACGYACLYAEAVRQGLATKVKMDPLSKAVINAANPAGGGAAVTTAPSNPVRKYP